MPQFRLVAFLVAILFTISALAEQPKNSASEVVAQMYEDFKWETKRTSNDKVTLDNSPPEVLSKYYDKKLVDLIIERRNCNYQMCGLDYSPMWNSMDPEGASVSVKSTARPNIVNVDVSYFNFTTRLTYYLRKTPAGWRITDLNNGKSSLVAILREPEPTTIEDPLLQAYYDEQAVHFESIKTQTFMPSCQRHFSGINPLPKELTLYSAYLTGTRAIYIAGIGDNIKLVVLQNGNCDTSQFPIFSITKKINSYTHKAVPPVLTDTEITGIFEDYLARHARAFGGKDIFFKWLDAETARRTISCKGQSEWVCPITYHGLQPTLQKSLKDFRND